MEPLRLFVVCEDFEEIDSEAVPDSSQLSDTEAIAIMDNLFSDDYLTDELTDEDMQLINDELNKRAMFS